MIQPAKYNGINFTDGLNRESDLYDFSLQRKKLIIPRAEFGFLSFQVDTVGEVGEIDALLYVKKSDGSITSTAVSGVDLIGDNKAILYFSLIPTLFTEGLDVEMTVKVFGNTIGIDHDLFAYSEKCSVVSISDFYARGGFYVSASNNDNRNGFLTNPAFGFFQGTIFKSDVFATEQTTFEYSYKRKRILSGENQIVKRFTFTDLTMYQQNLLKWLCNCQNLTINGKAYQLISEFSELLNDDNTEICDLRADFVEVEQSFFTNAAENRPDYAFPELFFVKSVDGCVTGSNIAAQTPEPVQFIPKYGDFTIFDTKTFDKNPVVPDNPTTNDGAVNKNYVKNLYDSIKIKMIEATPTIENSASYITSTGDIIPFAGAIGVSGKMLIESGATIFYTGSYGDEAAAIVFYNNTGEVIGSLTNSTIISVVKKEITTPSNTKYVRVCSLSSVLLIKGIIDLDATVAKNTSDINTINQSLPKFVRTTNNLINTSQNNINYYLTKTGGLQNYTGGRVSDYIPVIPTQILKYSGSYGQNACGIAFYDTDKTFISYQYESVNITGNVKGLDVTIPNNCEYVRVSSLVVTDVFELYDTEVATNKILEDRVAVVENSIDDLENQLYSVEINLDANNIKGTTYVESNYFGTAITEDSAYKEIDVTQIIYSASKVYANNKIFVCKLSTDTNSMIVEQIISIPDAVIGQNTVNVSFVLQKGRILYILGNDIYNYSNNIIPGSNINVFQATGLSSKNIGDTQNVTEKVPVGKEIRIIGIAKDMMKTATVQYLISEAVKNKANNILNGLVLSVTGDSEAAGHSIGKENTYGNLIALRNGMTINNYAINGRALKTGFATSLVDTYQEIALNSNYILIQIGYNDSFEANIADDSMDTTTFKGAFNILVLGLQSRYPNAKIGFIEPYYFLNTSLKPRAEWIKTRCEFYHIQCIDGTVKSGLRYDCVEQDGYFIDAVHLTVSGHLRMSYIYEDFIKGL